jgi:hypothetical protein
MTPILDQFVYYLSYDEQFIQAEFEVSDWLSTIKVYPAWFQKDFSNNPVLGCGHW